MFQLSSPLRFTRIMFAKIKPIFAFILIIMIMLLISSCSTEPNRKSVIVDKPVNIDLEETISTQTAEDKLALAQSLNTQTTPAEQQQFNLLLVQASELFLQQQNYTKALWLSNKSTDLIKDNNHYLYRLFLVKAASLQALNYHQQALQQLTYAHDLVLLTAEQSNDNADTNANYRLTLTLAYYQTLSAALFSQVQPTAAISANLTAFSLNTQANEQDVLLLWQQLSRLNQWQLTRLAKDTPPFFKGWQQLLKFSHKFGGDQIKFSRYLSLWQQNFPTHPAGVLIEQLKQTNLNVITIENIAVLLPLSGMQKSAGLVAQQGILAAFETNTTQKLHFIDANQVEWPLLAAQFSALQIDHVIGPLLKSNVTHFLTQSKEHIELQVPTLLLNLPQQALLEPHQIALSMRPEDEAIKAASTLSQQNYTRPIILSYQDGVSKRIAQTFQKQWQTLTGKEVEIFYFKHGKEMQASLKASLDVDASQTRINTLSSKLKQVIKTETRNRRDVDMIYVIGNAAQTRLIKPYIDVNTSPFASIIPVFASSRSHSYANSLNKDSINDLQGLTFTQMPWLLNSKQQNKSLANLSQKLWPMRSDNLSKIFAMGYDSYHLLGKVSLMQQAPYIRYFGQTGVLNLTENNILTRSLIWGKYQHNKVSQIALE